MKNELMRVKETKGMRGMVILKILLVIQYFSSVLVMKFFS